MSFWGQLGFQDSFSGLGFELAFFHDHAMFVLVLVSSFVGYMMICLLKSSLSSRFIVEAQSLEAAWTVAPGLLLLVLTVPSIRLLYLLDEVVGPMVSVKAIGHQWYWSYEFGDGTDLISFDSYMMSGGDESSGGYRLLEVDNRCVLPYGVNSRILVGSADVIHAWALPSVGVKVDAVPGRINQLGVYLMSSGVMYGQCSEICGLNHSFMPIGLESVSPKVFYHWLVC
uniref:Cytochrome c oxidase subunit 2 n=1 Tax=Potamilus streckersoni TaxID=2493646 RepID=A0A7U0FMF0_9BIVA|nr:cytochrome c oxidase subunit II [Potamilus streckersoni]QQV68442.1 cytochrome c oxidase subunit 2 [Potamilus streckersoni]UUA64274.1 cytochrome c oxidase subunit 2 [Potamilus streckersoni]